VANQHTAGTARLTRRQEVWLKAYLDPESPTRFNATASAQEVYKSRSYSTAATIGKQNSRKLQAWIDVWRRDSGLTPENLDTVLVAGLGAKRWVCSKTHGWKELDDLRVRHRYLVTGYERLGLLKNVQTVDFTGTVVHKVIGVPEYQRLLPKGEGTWALPAIPAPGNGQDKGNGHDVVEVG